eukprot:3493406-Prymnesium_polylepis.1
MRWLHEVSGSDNVYVFDRSCRVESWEIRKIWETCSDVTEMTGTPGPPGVLQGEQWWQRAAA